MLKSFLEKKIIFTIVFFALVAGAIVFAVIMPTITYIRQLDQETYDLRLTLERKSERVASYRRSLKQMDKIRSEMPNFSIYLFHAGQELSLITTLEGLATKTGITQRVNNSNLDSLTGQRLVMSITLTGQFKNVMNYVSELEKLPYFITITNTQLAAAVDKTGTGNQLVNMNIDLRLYVSQ